MTFLNSAEPAFVALGDERLRNPDSRDAAEVLVRHLFAPEPHAIPGIEYAVEYRLAIGRSGGDIVDIFPLEDGSVSVVVADISGKGTRASVQAALVKYSLRAFASAGFAPAESLERLDRLYRETVRFEESASFATVYVGRIDAARAALCYASAGHEVVAVKMPGERAELCRITAPAIGILPTFEVHQHEVATPPGTLLALATDGISEARRRDEFFGVEGFLASIDAHARESVASIACGLDDDAHAFSGGVARDDAALLIARIGRH